MKKKAKKQTKKQKTKSKPASKSAKATKAKPEETMDRKALKSIVSQLKEMGADIKVLKSDTDELLQKKVNETLQKMPPADVLVKLESIVPEKLVSILKKDCVGLFIDLSDVSCVRCKDNEACATAFLKNLKGNLSEYSNAFSVVPVTKYDQKRDVFVREVKNPNPKGDDYHDTFQRVLDDQPETLGELREIVEDAFDIEDDVAFMKFVTAMRDPTEGIIKLAEDLSEKNKAELRKAGYDV